MNPTRTFYAFCFSLWSIWTLLIGGLLLHMDATLSEALIIGVVCGSLGMMATYDILDMWLQHRSNSSEQ